MHVLLIRQVTKSFQCFNLGISNQARLLSPLIFHIADSCIGDLQTCSDTVRYQQPFDGTEVSRGLRRNEDVRSGDVAAAVDTKCCQP